MPRPEKVQAVAEIKERVEAAQAVFLAEYAGLSVKEQQEMRRALRATDGEFKVVKMTLAKLAVEELGHDDLAELLVGPTGLTFADHDAAATAKALQEFAKEHARLVIKGALFSGEVIPPEKVSELAELPSRDVLLAQIAGAFEAPMAKMAGLLAAMPRDLATMIQQLIDKLPEEAAPPASATDAADAPETDEASADEASADEASADEASAEEASAPGEADAPAADEEPAEEAEPAEEPETADAPEAEADTEEPAADEASDENDEADEAEEEK